jgi:hypothetical protein
VNFGALGQPLRAPIFPRRCTTKRKCAKQRLVLAGFDDDGCFSAPDLSMKNCVALVRRAGRTAAGD